METVVFLKKCMFGIATAMFAMTAFAASAASDDFRLQQNWVKRGLILEPGFAGPASAKFVSSPSVIQLKDGRLRMYVWVADGAPPWLRGHHTIVAAESDPADPLRWEVVSKQALVGPDAASKIRDRGVGFPHVVPRDDGPWLMYFGSWGGGDWTLKQELMNRIGLALSHDEGLTWTVINEDLLPSGPPGSFDAGAIPSAVVMRTGAADYLMWYTSAANYVRFGAVNQGILHIGVARSTDGIHWNKLARPALSPREAATHPYESGLARPAIVKLDGVYHMWVGAYDMALGSRPEKSISGATPSAAGTNRAGAGSYRLEYARSTDGVNWTRFPDQPVLPLTPGGFDSTSQAYASVVDTGEQLLLFYAGDGLGATGVGLATLDKNDFRTERETSR